MSYTDKRQGLPIGGTTHEYFGKSHIFWFVLVFILLALVVGTELLIVQSLLRPDKCPPISECPDINADGPENCYLEGEYVADWPRPVDDLHLKHLDGGYQMGKCILISDCPDITGTALDWTKDCYSGTCHYTHTEIEH